MKSLVRVVVVLSLLLIGIGLIFFVPSPNDFPLQTKKSEGEHGLEYRIVEIEGMPCIWIEKGFIDTSYAGASCDWSKWEGK